MQPGAPPGARFFFCIKGDIVEVMVEMDLMEKIVSLCKRRGFVYQGSEIYGGFAGTWDYGPLGAELVDNIKNCWWKKFLYDREDIYKINAAILMNPGVWE